MGLAGTWSQKFSLVRGRLTRFDGGTTRLILKEEPSRRLNFSVGALAGIALVGYLDPAEELAGSPAFLFNPEALAYLNLSDFARLSAGLGWRTALPFREVPGLEYWDCNGPTLSLNLVFGVFTPR